MHDLNVLIGPNGSGKSNFLEVFEILRALPRNAEDRSNILELLSKGGGIEQWIWNSNKRSQIFISVITLINDNPVFEHMFTLDQSYIDQEYINNIFQKDVSNLYKKVFGASSTFDLKTKKLEPVEDAPHLLSILSQRSGNKQIGMLANQYESIRLYREWPFGRNTVLRAPQPSDQRNNRLESDFSNLGMVLSRLRKDPITKRALITGLQELYEGLTDFEVIIEGGTVQIFFTEGDYSIPATRLSDGSLRYLCLLAILLDPTPPPLICIEEPELGLHPDIMPQIADLLINASKRTQLVVTTHSDVLIDALSEQPESVLVCEKHEGQTHIKRLDKDEIGHWLKDYRLGQLWTRGEIGGNRW